MRFELTEALIDDILFSMEDQGEDFLVDTREGIIVGGIDSDFDESFENDEGRFIALPEWDSSDGYRLMEHFTAGLRNPLLREELTVALNRGKGVFRAFKDTLSHHAEAEKRWFSFKEREMKRNIVLWYNSLRDSWGLEHIGTEPEETEDLVLEDFIFREPTQQDVAAAAELHRFCREEYRIADDEQTRSFEPERFLQETYPFPGDLTLMAETGGGDFAAYIATVQHGKTLSITALEVKAEYRGLGIGEALCTRLLDKLDPHTISTILMDMPVEAEKFAPVLLRKSFKPYATRYCLNLRDLRS
ncbi:MAG: GNAT family N-acetyltransferase [Treponema sp.]|jgi:GNAT superfamily N-acetyltransferase|nr:GNAT family N-acetyltransferase [Treponema sp.]